MERCIWPGKNELMIKYHDEEWGVPLHDDKKLFEFLVLDTFQAGLSWEIVLKKREGFRKAFHKFEFKKIAKYSGEDVTRLKNDEKIIRNELKIKATIVNAQKFLEIIREYGNFDRYIWGFVNNKPIKNKFKSLSDLPSTSKESDLMSEDLKKRGFKFVGSTICYAFMQAAGLINDHVENCFRYKEV